MTCSFFTARSAFFGGALAQRSMHQALQDYNSNTFKCACRACKSETNMNNFNTITLVCSTN
jgi:hypothetical protein